MHKFKNEELKTIDDILLEYGNESQCTMAMEECAELIQAINKNLRNKEDARNMLVEEIADVTIVLKQLCIMFNIEEKEINEIISFKLNRQKERLKKEKSK